MDAASSSLWYRIAAENAQAQFSPKASAVLNVLAAVVTAPDSRNDDNCNATENAFSAI